MNPPLFSIIIPTFNAEKTLQACLESISVQHFQENETIIIDGKSSDETLKIIEKYQELMPGLKYISELDQGIYDAMNKGISLASGEWLYFLGSDDCLYKPETLIKVSQRIKENKRSRIIYGNVLTSDGKVQSYQGHNYTKLLNLNICHQAIFYHHSHFKKHQYNTKYTICADWDLNLKIFKRANFPLYIELEIACYDLNGASSNWSVHPDYLLNFSDKRKLILRYRSLTYLIYSYLVKIPRKAISLFQ